MPVQCKWNGCPDPAKGKTSLCAAHSALAEKELRERKSLSGFAAWLSANVGVGVVSSYVVLALNEAERSGVLSSDRISQIFQNLAQVLPPGPDNHVGVTPEKDNATVLRALRSEGLDDVLAAVLITELEKPADT